MKATEQLRRCGQSIWLDFISRELIRSGELKQMVEHCDLTGVTSNPTIFEKAIDGGHDYDLSLSRLIAVNQRLTPYELYEHLSIEDVRMTADILRGSDHTHGADGFVSIEVSPHVAQDTNASISEGMRLWEEVDRPNQDPSYGRGRTHY